MALKVIVLLLVCFLLVATRVSSKDEEPFMEATYVITPVKPPAPAPVVKPPTPAPAPPIAPVVKPPPAPAPPVKPPTTPVVKPPPAPVPPIKPPTPPVVKPAPPVTPPPKAPTPPIVKPPTPTTPVKPPSPPVILPPVKITECPRLCEGRCKMHSRPRHCKRVCTTCCVRCKCVPPGTYGNKEMCGKCYTDMTTHGNKPKCP